MDDDNDESFTSEEDYYAFLNVSKNATPEEISTAYRNLSRMYHPDKHMDDNKSQAEFLFNRMKKAYEVLSDPTKRAIYDSLGVRGLETEGWEIVHRTRTPQEIREEYERLAREREERKLQQRTNPKGNITVNINATDIFASYDDEFDEGPPFPIIEVSGMSISQSIEAPMTLTDTVTMSGSLSSQNGIGSGGFVISGRRLINKGWFELDAGAGNGPVIGLKGSRNLSSKVFANGGLNLNFRRGAMLPGLVGTLAVQLDKHTVGYLTLNAGIQSSMSTVLEHNSERQHCLLNLTIGIPHCYISGSYTRKFPDHELKIRLAAKVGTFGYIAEYGVDKKVTKYSSAAATVSIGVPSGVTLKLRITRSSQTFIFPIHLSEEIVPAAVFYATVTPLLVWFVVKKAIVEPMNNDEKKRKLDKAKELNKQRMAEKKREAEVAVDLMQAMYARIQNDEEKKKGLIILSAHYGTLEESAGDNLSDEDSTIDVTVPLQCLIKDSKLSLYESAKSELPGFYDPCMGEDKQLRIEYIFREQRHRIVIKDSESLTIPQTNGNQNNT